MEQDDICVGLDPSVTSDDILSASWDFDWDFTGMHPRDPDGTNKAERRAKPETDTPQLVYDEALDQTFQVGKGVHALLAPITDRFQEDQFRTEFKDTHVIMVDDETRNHRYLVIRGAHSKEIKHQIAEKFQIFDMDENTK